MDINLNDSEEYFEDSYTEGESSIKNSIFPSKKYLLLFSILAIILLILIEKLFIIIFLAIFPSYFFLIITMIILHLILLRYLIMTAVFPGRNRLINFYIRDVMAKIRAKTLNRSLTKFQTKIDKILSFQGSGEACEISDNLNKSKVTSRYLDIYEGIQDKYGELSSYSKIFFEQLLLLKNKIENSALQEYIKKLNRNENAIPREKDITDFQEIKIVIQKIQTILNQLRNEDWFGPQKFINYIKNLYYNDILRSKEFARVSALLKKPSSKEITITSNDNKNLDCLIIYSNNKGENLHSSNLIIVCGPNLTPFENLINSWDIDNLYLCNDTDILFWNYRGYGFSDGIANFNNIREDIICIYDYITQQNNYKKIGVHGLSIGGIAACHLASQRNICLLIADRTFGSTQGVLDNFIFGKYLGYLGKFLFIPFVDNAENFMKANCNKILLNDVEDRTIADPISLKTVIAQKIIFKIFNETNPELNIRNSKSNNIIDYALEPDDANQIYNAFNYTINFLKNKSQKSHGINHIKKMNSVDDKVQELNDIFEDEININEEDNSVKDVLNNFYEKIKNEYSNFVCVGDSLERFLDFQNTLTHFHNFFNSLVIYGPDDIQLKQYSLCNILYTDTILDKFIKEMGNFLNNDEIRVHSNLELYKKLEFFVSCLKNLKTFILEMHLEEKENQWIKKIKGILIPLFCGHISFYDDKEFETLKYLVKSTFNGQNESIENEIV